MVEEDKEEYIDMKPSNNGARAGDRTSVYENITHGDGEANDEDFYSVPHPRGMIPPSDSGSSDGSRPGSAARSNRLTLPPREEQDTATEDDPKKRTLTLPAVSSTVHSQYSVATNFDSQASHEFLADTPTGALSPTRVKYLPTALPSSSTSTAAVPEPSKFHSALGVTAEMGERENGRGFQSASPSARPRPKPRKNAQRSASISSSGAYENTARTKFSLPEKTPTDMDLIKLTDAIQGSSLLRRSPTPEDLEPLIPFDPPPVPERTYLSPTHSTNSDAPDAGKAVAHEAPANLYNPLAEEFPDADAAMCLRALLEHGSDIEKAREEVQVQILLGMRIPNTDAEDCRRALNHCQGKIDRAASWLVERNLELED